MLTPSYLLTVGGRRVDSAASPGESTLLDLCVQLDLDAPADAATLLLAQVGGITPARGNDVTVELGYADEEGSRVRVLTGRVSSLRPGLAVNRVGIEGAIAPLLRLFVDETYEGRTAGDIARDLAGKAGVAVAQADDGPSFPAYVVDGRRPAWHHLRDLASLAGFDVYADDQGRLVFRRFQQGNAVHVLKRGRDLISLEVRRTEPAAGAVEAWGESPAGSQGEEAWGWLTNNAGRSKGTAGSGARHLLERPALRTPAAARAAAEAVLTDIRRRGVRGEALIAGRPAVRLGDAVRLEETGAVDADGTYQVRSVTHRLSKAHGFTTAVGFRGMGSA
jgi:phage protein D